jgi:hypothetical protein
MSNKNRYRFAYWSRLRSIGHSSLAKSTIVVPFVGYLILFNEKLQDYLRISTELLGYAHSETSGLPRLLFIYFGLCFIAFASALFNWFSPLQTKKYASAEEYIAGDEPYLTFHTQGSIEHELETGDAEARGLLNDLNAIQRPTPQTLEEIRHQGAESFRVKMQLYFEMLDRSNPIVRWLIILSYTIGFLSLSVPAIRVFARVCAILFSLLWN